MSNKIRVAQMGLGPIGNSVTPLLAERAGLQIVAAIDNDPAKVGQDVYAVAGLPARGVRITADLSEALGKRDVDVVVLTTTSSLSQTRDQLFQLLPYRVHVVSSCEELSYPWVTDPEIAIQIDNLAKKNGVAVLGTGVNPGFLMDFLPVAMTGVCRNVRRVTVERIQDASFRRVPFQRKIGAGLSVQEFHRKVKEGALRHVGLTESIHMIAACMGWKLEQTQDIISPIIAERETRAGSVVVRPGDALGVQQLGRGVVAGEEVISMVFRAALGEPNPRDRIVIEGTPSIDTCIQGGVHGDVATCAILVNAIPSLMRARAGLRTMVDIEPLHCLTPDLDKLPS